MPLVCAMPVRSGGAPAISALHRFVGLRQARFARASGTSVAFAARSSPRLAPNRFELPAAPPRLAPNRPELPAAPPRLAPNRSELPAAQPRPQHNRFRAARSSRRLRSDGSRAARSSLRLAPNRSELPAALSNPYPLTVPSAGSSLGDWRPGELNGVRINFVSSDGFSKRCPSRSR